MTRPPTVTPSSPLITTLAVLTCQRSAWPPKVRPRSSMRSAIKSANGNRKRRAKFHNPKSSTITLMSLLCSNSNRVITTAYILWLPWQRRRSTNNSIKYRASEPQSEAACSTSSNCSTRHLWGPCSSVSIPQHLTHWIKERASLTMFQWLAIKLRLAVFSSRSQIIAANLK